MKLSKAVWISAAWTIAALLFNTGILFFQGQQKALEFLTGYLIELSLSIDNLFVFFLIFSYFKVDRAMQTRILFWGVLGAQLMRAVLILAGVVLLKHLIWAGYAFGIFVTFSGFRLFFKIDKTIDFGQNVLLRFLTRIIPDKLSSFLLVLVVVEAADLVFALDSIPAVLAVTKDPFIVYSSNIFAILGLRSIYFVLSPVIDSFKYLHYTLGIILVFVGLKMFVDPIWHMPIGYALGFMVFILTVFMLITLFLKSGFSSRGDLISGK